MKRAISLLSGGLDSTVSLAIAKSKGIRVKSCLFFDYGQLAARSEERASRSIARYYDVPFKKVTLGWLRDICKTALVNKASSLPALRMRDLDNKARTLKTARAVWVPNRNGVFINIAASIAESDNIELILTGFNREEGETFPDNSGPYVVAVNNSLAYSTLKRVKVKSFTQGLSKREIVAVGRKLGTPLELIWSCYRSGSSPCLKCESCLRSERAMGVPC